MCDNIKMTDNNSVSGVTGDVCEYSDWKEFMEFIERRCKSLTESLSKIPKPDIEYEDDRGSICDLSFFKLICNDSDLAKYETRFRCDLGIDELSEYLLVHDAEPDPIYKTALLRYSVYLTSIGNGIARIVNGKEEIYYKEAMVIYKKILQFSVKNIFEKSGSVKYYEDFIKRAFVAYAKRMETKFGVIDTSDEKIDKIVDDDKK